MLKAKVIVKGNCIICGKPIDNDNVFFCKVCERGNYMSELDDPISEKKMQIVINNYFKAECDVNTSIREAFEKGFRTGVQKGQCIKHAPSVQPEPIRINLNEPIKVKLTDWGKEIYYHQYDRINQIAGREICKPKFPKEDENGYTEFQLWCFIELYGEHMGMTMPNVIEPLEIVYERRT